MAGIVGGIGNPPTIRFAFDKNKQDGLMGALIYEVYKPVRRRETRPPASLSTEIALYLQVQRSKKNAVAGRSSFLALRFGTERRMRSTLGKEIRFKPDGEDYRGKRLLVGKQSMLDLPYRLWRKVSL